MRNALIGLLGPLLVRLIVGSLRVRYIGVAEREGRLPRRPVGIFLFWHQRMVAFAGLFHHNGFKAIVSQHGDGEMIARICEGLGIQAIRGSSTRGGTRAIREVLRNDAGEEIRLAITPDGPRGPRHVLQEGAIYLASRTGLPLYPVAFSFSRAIQLPTWDGFLIPVPFARAVLRLGERVDVPPDLDRDGIEATRTRVESALRELTESTDAAFEQHYGTAKSVCDLVEVSACGQAR